MARKQQRYPPEFRREIVGLVRSGRTPESLAREFEPSASAIRKWVKQADLDEGRRSDGLTTFERQELRRAKREIKRLRMERDILKKGGLYTKVPNPNPHRRLRGFVIHRMFTGWTIARVRFPSRSIAVSPGTSRLISSSSSALVG